MAGQEFWKFLAGITLFIMGMRFLEEALRRLAGRSFKLFLKRNSQTKLRGLLSGSVVAMVLQSSSIVNLLVLAFVGAGVIALQNGLALILGANLGAVSITWLMALVGFQMDIEAYALPLVGIAGILYNAFNKESAISKWCLFLLGFGLLFSGLGFIKNSASLLAAKVDFVAIADYPHVVFILVGFLLTAIVQSSSAVIALAMSVVMANALSLQHAMAIVLGAEVGTTLKMLFAAIGGSADKKRVALADFLFSVITMLLLAIFLVPIQYFIVTICGVHEPVIAVVVFQTLFNIVGILLFLPFLNPIAKWLNEQFTAGEKKSIFLTDLAIADKLIAIETLRNEVMSLLQHVLIFSRKLFGSETTAKHVGYFQKDFENLTTDEQYNYIKVQHGEIYNFYIRMQDGTLKSMDIVESERLVDAARNATYAAKNFKDCAADVQEFSNSSKDQKFDMYRVCARQMATCTHAMEQLLFTHDANKHDALMDFHRELQLQYRGNIKTIYGGIVTSSLREVEVTTAMNLNREITTGLKSLSMAAKDVLLDEQQAEDFEDLPGFIR
ncbi:MAG TPA: Na/Pi symporter [Phnomibacter sp.]|nr:Na/Pi symporter [Phnomibacter sp.]